MKIHAKKTKKLQFLKFPTFSSQLFAFLSAMPVIF
jgi:hypothetical protein